MGPHQFVEQVHHLRPARLQLFDHFLAGQQVGLLLVQFVDLGDLRLDQLDLVLQVEVAGFLALDLAVVVHDDQEAEQQCCAGS